MAQEAPQGENRQGWWKQKRILSGGTRCRFSLRGPVRAWGGRTVRAGSGHDQEPGLGPRCQTRLSATRGLKMREPDKTSSASRDQEAAQRRDRARQPLREDAAPRVGL